MLALKRGLVASSFGDDRHDLRESVCCFVFHGVEGYSSKWFHFRYHTWCILEQSHGTEHLRGSNKDEPVLGSRGQKKAWCSPTRGSSASYRRWPARESVCFVVHGFEGFLLEIASNSQERQQRENILMLGRKLIE